MKVRPVNFRYGHLVETFNNGCLVVACMPYGYEIAVTRPGQEFPIRTLNGKDGKPWRAGNFAEAQARAKQLVEQLTSKYGKKLPSHLEC